jgi:hypothetical protein
MSVIDVRVRDRTLWIGPDDYPLRTVTRVTVSDLAPDRVAVVGQYAITVARWLLPAAVLSAVTPDSAAAVVIVTALVWFTTRTAALARSMRSTAYELKLATVTGPHRILVGDDLATIAEIGFRITEAINDPRLEFSIPARTRSRDWSDL